MSLYYNKYIVNFCRNNIRRFWHFFLGGGGARLRSHERVSCNALTDTKMIPPYIPKCFWLIYTFLLIEMNILSIMCTTDIQLYAGNFKRTRGWFHKKLSFKALQNIDLRWNISSLWRWFLKYELRIRQYYNLNPKQ